MFFEYKDRLGAGDITLTSDIRDLEIVHLNSGTFLVSSTGLNGGLVSYQLDATGRTIAVTDRVFFSQDAGEAVSGTIDVVTYGSTAMVVAAGGASTAIVQYWLTADGSFSTAAAISATQGSSDVASLQVTAGRATYSVAQDSGQVARHIDGSAGTAQQVVLDGVTALDTVQVGTQSFLLASEYGTNSISSYRINSASGALTQADDLGAEEGLSITAPTTFDTVTAFGQTWVVLGSAGTSTLSVLSLNAAGQMAVVDHIMDTRETRFGGVHSVEIAQVGDRVFVIAGGSDDGLSLHTLMPDGRLIHLETIPHTTGANLMNVDQIEVSVMGDALQIFVSSATDASIVRYVVDLSDLGSTQRGDADAAGRLTGGVGDDMLVAGEGDTVLGGDGDDIIVGALDARLTGGAGADRFVLSETGGKTRILDFTPGVDILDFSSYFMLRTADQLSVNATSSGARISLRDTVVEVQSTNGMSLDSEDLFGLAFEWADRIPILERTAAPPEANPTPVVVVPPVVTPTPVVEPPVVTPTPVVVPPVVTPTPVTPVTAMVIAGGDSADRIEGNVLNDKLTGGGGADSLFGSAGDDSLFGGNGSDMLFGGADDDFVAGAAGNDVLDGGSGADDLRGGDGNDLIRGDLGEDTIYGDAGNDTLQGDGGADLILGDVGNDRLEGGVGRDTLYGGAGNDVLIGGDDADIVRGDVGDDQVLGASGNDTIYGDSGNDTLQSGDGNDSAWGGDGNDQIVGEAGYDTLKGGYGDDLMFGGTEADEVWGDQGNDTMYGNEGNDTLGGFFGEDVFYGGDGNDEIWGNLGEDRGWGGSGNDTLGGGGDNDELYGEDGNDLVWGGSDGDQLSGGAGVDTVGGFHGNDYLNGDGGNDEVWGNRGRDTLLGGDGNDLLGAGADNDVLYGGNGKDDLRGGEGSDTLTGGNGADTFYFRFDQGGTDVITDFNPNADMIRIAVIPVKYRDLDMRQQGNDVVIELKNFEIRVEDTRIADLSDDVFQFG